MVVSTLWPSYRNLARVHRVWLERMKLDVTVVHGCTEQQVYKTHRDNHRRWPGCHHQLYSMHVVIVPGDMNGCRSVSHLPC